MKNAQWRVKINNVKRQGHGHEIKITRKITLDELNDEVRHRSEGGRALLTV